MNFRRLDQAGAQLVEQLATVWPELEATLAAIAGAGGIAVLAHPLRYRFSAGQRRATAKARKTSCSLLSE